MAQNLAMVQAEMETITNMFNRMTDLCFKKCVPNYFEGDLNVGEMACADRCVAKYLESQQNVMEEMQKLQQAQQEQLQALQASVQQQQPMQ